MTRIALFFGMLALFISTENVSGQSTRFLRWRNHYPRVVYDSATTESKSCLIARTYPMTTVTHQNTGNTPSIPLRTPFFETETPLSVADPNPANAITQGDRPINILVAIAPKELVARSTVSWGVNDASGKTVSSGRHVFTHEGGVVFGEIPADANSPKIRILVKVDYLQHEFTDLEYIFEPEVTSAGVSIVVPTTSNLVTQQIVFRSLKTVRDDDYLVIDFETKSNEQIQKGTTLLQPNELKHAIKSIFVKSLGVPLKNEDNAEVHWTIRGRLNGNKVEKSFSIKNRDAIEVSLNRQGDLEVWFGS